jgi:FkbM family methyltransferase
MKTRALRVPIIAGPLRGRWWLPASRGKVLRILNGTYERAQTRVFQQWVRAGDAVLDIGAHVGYYTLLASALVGDGGAVYAFEPHPRNFRFLAEHVRINGRTNVHAEQCAVAAANGTSQFAIGTGSGTGRLAPQGMLPVRTVRLDDFCSQLGIVPAAVKIDVEGAEGAVLDGAPTMLGAARPVIFLSTHGAAVGAHCLELLRQLSYAFQPIVGAAVENAAEILCLPAARRR